MLLFYLSRDCNYISPAIKPFWDNKKWPNSIRHSSDIAVRSLYSNLSDKHGDDRRDVSPREFFLTWDIPSGNLLYSYWKWPSRNSGWLPIIAMVIFFPSFFVNVYQRLVVILQQWFHQLPSCSIPTTLKNHGVSSSVGARWHSQLNGKVIKFHGSKAPTRYICV